MQRPIGSFIVLLSSLVFACRAEPGASEQGAVPPPPSAAATARPATEASAICLSDPDGASRLDHELRKYQEVARALNQKPDAWTMVGRSWVQKARTSFDPGFYLNVDRCAAIALRIDPKFAPALNLRALARMNDHRFAEARAIADEILASDPEDAMAAGTRSDALLELGQFAGAAEMAQKMVDLKPNMASYSRGAYLRWLTGDRGAAKAMMKQALVAGMDARDPEPSAWTLVQAGLIYWNEGDYEGADAVFAEALKLMPDYPSALVGRARSAMALSQPNRAREYLERAYHLSPLPETAWLLGDARAMTGDATGAKAAYEDVVKQGKSVDAMTLSLFYSTKNLEPERALAAIEEERKTRGGVYVDDAYAWALHRAGRLEAARAASERALALGTRDARLLYHAGAIRIAAGDIAGGSKLVREALALNPRFDLTGADEANKLLAANGRPEYAGARPE